MMQGSDWPAPTAPPTPETWRERAWRLLPAVAVAGLLHVGVLFVLLRDVSPWVHAPPPTRHGDAIEIVFVPVRAAPTIARTDVAPAAADADAAPPLPRADAVPFPASRPVPSVSELDHRPDTPAAPAPISGQALFDAIPGGLANGDALDPNRTPRGSTRLPGRDDAFIDVPVRFRPPPPTPQQIARAVGSLLLSTTAANPTTGLMGAIPGRDPLREMQDEHVRDLYLPRDCDNPEHPNLSDACMGIPKR